MRNPSRIHPPADARTGTRPDPRGRGPDAPTDLQQMFEEAQRLIDRARLIRETSLAQARTKRPIERLKP